MLDQEIAKKFKVDIFSQKLTAILDRLEETLFYEPLSPVKYAAVSAAYRAVKSTRNYFWDHPKEEFEEELERGIQEFTREIDAWRDNKVLYGICCREVVEILFEIRDFYFNDYLKAKKASEQKRAYRK